MNNHRPASFRCPPCLAALTVVCALLVSLPGAAHADVAYSNLGVGDTYNIDNYLLVSAPGGIFGFSQSSANAFTASFSGTMRSVEVAIGGYTGPDTVMLNLYANDPTTNLPFVPSRLTLGSLATAVDPGGLMRLTLSTPAPLAAGLTYWLELAPGNDATATFWYYANDTGANPASFSPDGGATFLPTNGNAASAFRINADVAVVPEPRTWALVMTGGLGALFLAGWRRRP